MTKEEITVTMHDILEAINNLPFYDTKQKSNYKFGQYITALQLSVDELKEKAIKFMNQLDRMCR